jgi:protein-L-isoaspartate(D-aspartate) O-methyltransferase
VLAELAGRVYSVELIDELAERAGQLLKRQGYTNIEVRVANGYFGYPRARPIRQGDGHGGAGSDPSSPD